MQPWASPSASLGLVSFLEKGLIAAAGSASLVVVRACRWVCGCPGAFLPGFLLSAPSDPTLTDVGLMLGKGGAGGGKEQKPQTSRFLSPRSLINALAY